MRIQRWTPALYVGLIAAQTAVALSPSLRRLSWSYAIVLAAIALTVLLCARRIRLAVPHNKPLWSLLLFSLLARGSAMALLLFDSLENAEGTLIMADPTLWFCISSLGLIAAAAYDPATPLLRWTTAIDWLIGGLAAALFYGVTRQPELAREPATLIILFDILDGFVACFAGIRLLGTRRVDERRFYAVLFVITLTDAVAAAAHNRLLFVTESYLPELLLLLPLACLGVLLARRRPQWLRNIRPTTTLRRLSVSARPMALCLMTCAAAVMLARFKPVLGLWSIVITLVLFVGRATIVAWYQLSVEDQLRRLRRSLQHAATHDPLTRIRNRRGIFQWMEREYRMTRHDDGLCVAMIDVDFFKLYNDRFGHQAGDECLIRVGRALADASATLGRGAVGRIGGEEFLVAIGGIDRVSAIHFLNGIRAAFADGQADQDHAAITLSMGVAFADGHTWPSLDVLLRRADEALYAAKSRGRNRVVVHGFMEDGEPFSVSRSDTP
ncbi:GGDEF domain-containing protein [Luteibacter aegosomatis]|uniref:GGDEF domain-containing protein n=1 Tax=Luteibacter aegosomatis TaxID=2911537 RepID=UPI001FF8B29E|nr:GGDEF domain-containing protein [Luteibacter aegosomatis]UPG85820.1 GGDEF domain-containing protein [Luteibacter aegosomatis]